MTSQTYQTDDGQLVHEHEQMVQENNLMETEADLAEPEADLAVADPDLAEPEADLAVPGPDLAGPEADLAEPEADQTGHDDATSRPAEAPALVAHESVSSTASDYLGFIPDGDDGAEEPGMADTSSGTPSLATAATMVPESVTESHLAGNTASADAPWNEIKAMFVDDPRASIEQAAGLVDDRVEALIQSVKERQSSMRSVWQADDAGTEELRVALQLYRSFWSSLEDLPAQA